MDTSLIDQFIAVTSSSPSTAEQYLRLGDNNLEQAVGLFFANDGAELDGPAHVGYQPPAPTSSLNHHHHETGYTDDTGVVHVDSDEEELSSDRPRDSSTLRNNSNINPETLDHGRLPPGNTTPPVNSNGGNVDEDEAMARRLQEEFYGGAQAGDPTSTGVDEHGYRAPIARTTQTLVGPDSFDPTNQDDMRAAVMEQMMARRQPRQRERPGIFNQDTTSAIWNDRDGRRGQLARATGGASESSSKANVLAEMYRPPFELISNLSWEEARDEGKQNEKWILVNIQDPSIFDCQLLNRDLWKNPGVLETVKENFIFIQYSKDNPRGSPYIQYYFPNKDVDSAYPHIAIVDPRTGEQVKIWSGPPPPKAMDFLMQLHEFLDRYSLKASAKNPVAKRKAEPRKETQVDRMSEEQQMEMALQASLAGANEGHRESDPDDLTRSIGNLAGSNIPKQDENESDKDESSQVNGNLEDTSNKFKSVSSVNPHSEPPADQPSTTRIQFRHPNGRIVRRFALTDPVRRIYEWLKASPIEGKEGLEFGLVFMQKNLLESLDETIDAAGLKNGTVMVEFVEEG